MQARPVLGWVIACGGTLSRTQAGCDARAIRSGRRLAVGRRDRCFPEGTTSDGRELLPFHANLLQAAVKTGTALLPIALRYSDATSARSEAALWVGETTLMQTLWRIAGAERLTVTVRLLAPMQSADVERRELARRARDCIGAALDEAAS